jgi:beta-glucosidase
MSLYRHLLRTHPLALGVAILSLTLLPSAGQAGPGQKTTPAPWMNSSLSPDERAALVVKEMTLDEKVSLLHGTGMAGLGPISPLSAKSNGGAGYVVGVPRLGIPDIQMSDAAYGVRSSGENGRYSTA